MIDVLTWIDVPGYEGYYKMLISENRVMSLNYRRMGIAKELKPNIDKTGHYSFGFFSKNIYIHQIVMLIKEGPCPEGMVVCHNDGNPQNNNPDNLRYGTHKSNTNDMRRHGTMFFIKNNPKPSLGKFGKDNPTSKPVNQYTKEGVFVKEWDSITNAHMELGLQISNITHCCRGRLRQTGGFIWKYKY